jgi:hypothetical protein
LEKKYAEVHADIITKNHMDRASRLRYIGREPMTQTTVRHKN